MNSELTIPWVDLTLSQSTNSITPQEDSHHKTTQTPNTKSRR